MLFEIEVAVEVAHLLRQQKYPGASARGDGELQRVIFVWHAVRIGRLRRTLRNIPRAATRRHNDREVLWRSRLPKAIEGYSGDRRVGGLGRLLRAPRGRNNEQPKQ